MKLSVNSTEGQCNIQFEADNGYVLSCGMGRGNYSDAIMEDDGIVSATTMEIAILDKDGNFAVIPEQVAGWIPVSRLSELLIAVGNEDWGSVLDIAKGNPREKGLQFVLDNLDKFKSIYSDD